MGTNFATAPHRLVCYVPACVAGSGERQLRFDVVCDGGVDDVAVDPAVRLEVDAHPVGRRGSNCHSLFDTDADEPGMDIEDALPAAERQQVGILDKGLLQTLAEAFSIKAGPPRFNTKRWLDAMTTSIPFQSPIGTHAPRRRNLCTNVPHGAPHS
jgi:hypothetical protein